MFEMNENQTPKQAEIRCIIQERFGPLLEEARKREEERERLRQQKEEEYRRQSEKRRRIYMRYYENPSLFLETEGLYCYDPDGSISSQELYQIYRNWCIREDIPIETPRAFWLHIKAIAPQHAMTYCTLTDSRGKRVRGFRGIRPVTQETDNTDIHGQN